ncbi:MAG: efflux RND transporter periplasmic adaptor subunit, partial [Myxococcota bacterium]
MKERRTWLLPLGILGVAGLGGVTLLATSPPVDTVAPEAASPAVRVMSAEPGSFPQIVRSQGTVAPRTESELVPEVSGRVVWTAPSLVTGGFFSKGDLLLRLDGRDHETALARAEANLARAQGEWEHARAMLSRREELARKDVNSIAQLDDARRAARVADAVREEARAALRQATRDLERTQIRAPFTGRVRDERVDVGQFLSRGQAIATLYAIDYVEIRLPVPDSELAFLSLPLFAGTALEEGPAVTLRANFAGREQEWSGRIVRTEGEIDPRSRMVHVVARVEEPYATSRGVPLAVGLFVEAEIDGPALSGVL